MLNTMKTQIKTYWQNLQNGDNKTQMITVLTFIAAMLIGGLVV